MEHAQLADLAGCHHRAHLPDHGIAGVVVRQHEESAASRGDPCESHPVLKRRGQRLVADHVQTALKADLGGGEVKVVGRDHHDDFHAVGPHCLVGYHVLHCGVGAIGGDAGLRGGGPGPLRIGGEDPGDEFEMAVQAGGDPVHATDERTAAAADHAKLD